MWFIKKYKEEILKYKTVNNRLAMTINAQNKTITELREKLKAVPSMADLMRESLGMQIDLSSASEEKGMPPHFLEDLDGEERQNFIIDMESIYSNDRFQKVVRYMINLFGMNALYKADPDQMKNGQIAAVAFRTFLKELRKMHNEFESYKQGREDFDEHGVLPE